MKYSNLMHSAVPTKRTTNPQSEPLVGQINNAAGGHYYEVDDWAKLDRFLILGTSEGTYYVSAQKLTKENAQVIIKLLQIDGKRVVERIVEISKSSRAPKNDPALFALALAVSQAPMDTRKDALMALPSVAHTGTHLLQFAGMVTPLRGWGRGLRKGIANWFLSMPPERLCLQAIKYSQREGWALRDLLRLSHPKANVNKEYSQDHALLFDWIAHPTNEIAITKARNRFRLLQGKLKLNYEDLTLDTAANIIEDFKLPREAVPTELLKHKEIWQSLLLDMPMTAMIRNLGKMTNVGLLAPLNNQTLFITQNLRNKELLKKAKIHPITLLLALKTYAQGHGELGKLSWSPVQEICDALGEAFYASFEAIEPTNKRIMVGVDVSGSMQHGKCAGSPSLSVVEAVMAMAMVYIRSEPRTHIVGFDTDGRDLNISKTARINDVIQSVKQWGGGTDLSVPIRLAIQNKTEVDAFIILTDNETWAGKQHPVQALFQYRKQFNKDAKLIVVATSATSGSIVEPGDPLSLGVAGFDASVPQIIREFI